MIFDSLEKKSMYNRIEAIECPAKGINTNTSVKDTEKFPIKI